jgi:SAM-dependent methyltransferase
MAQNYLCRPPYSPEVYATLLGLFEDRPRKLLDAGCGPGKITLGLIDRIDTADAIDRSDEMLHVARALPNADSPKIRWIRATIEDAPLNPPYGLIVAGASIQWMDPDRVLPRFGAALANGGLLAVLDGDAPVDAPWEREETTFMIDFLERIDGKRPDWWRNARQRLGEAILVHPGFQRIDRKITAPVEVLQTVEDYLRCQHSRATWSEDHLGEQASAEFDAAMTALLSRYAAHDMLTFAVQTRIEWGRITI